VRRQKHLLARSSQVATKNSRHGKRLSPIHLPRDISNKSYQDKHVVIRKSSQSVASRPPKDNHPVTTAPLSARTIRSLSREQLMMPSPKMVVTAPGDHRTISRTSPRLTRASARQNQVDTGISSQTIAIASSIGNPNDASFCSQALLISHVESQITSMSTSQAAVIASPSGNESGTVPYSKELATASMQEEQHSDLPPSQANAVSVASEDNTIVLTQSAPLFDQFHAFPKLPVELRLAIWELTLPKSRRVTVNQQKIRTRSDKKPVLLDVNQESRTLTLKRYVEVYANRNHWHIARGLPPKWPVQFIAVFG
jgi:hypothetical protein